MRPNLFTSQEFLPAGAFLQQRNVPVPSLDLFHVLPYTWFPDTGAKCIGSNFYIPPSSVRRSAILPMVKYGWMDGLIAELSFPTPGIQLSSNKSLLSPVPATLFCSSRMICLFCKSIFENWESGGLGLQFTVLKSLLWRYLCLRILAHKALGCSKNRQALICVWRSRNPRPPSGFDRVIRSQLTTSVPLSLDPRHKKLRWILWMELIVFLRQF